MVIRVSGLHEKKKLDDVSIFLLQAITAKKKVNELQHIPLKLAPAVMETVAGHWLGAIPGEGREGPVPLFGVKPTMDWCGLWLHYLAVLGLGPKRGLLKKKKAPPQWQRLWDPQGGDLLLWLSEGAC